MTDRRWSPDMVESPSTGSGGQSSVLCPGGPPVYRENLRLHSVVIIIFTFINPYIPTTVAPGLGEKERGSGSAAR